jgi:hypothetical protein
VPSWPPLVADARDAISLTGWPIPSVGETFRSRIRRRTVEVAGGDLMDTEWVVGVLAIVGVILILVVESQRVADRLRCAGTMGQ